ncbi:DUF805 domain-containing protein [Ochrobactrum sp. Marseille-Q0166]|uniref:DUF805 domain-containing protein n=1 Tax=Ochrobactrum sp. Marseille-Q0166 TaxID=2761105 RepID=UPI001654C896|nr:DUF805 domain-containing protein [Ochrobactrum sp. Marseille-Q0166]MBC8719943.1 DUF805 domain-containing protein [Ochrobactrum sp. Marseille-Q0166]
MTPKNCCVCFSWDVEETPSKVRPPTPPIIATFRAGGKMVSTLQSDLPERISESMLSILVISIVALLLAVSALFFLNKPSQGPNRFGPGASPVDFPSAVRRFFSNCFDFKGRASQTEFWYAMLFYVATGLLLGFLQVPDMLITIFLLGTLIPFLSVAARRLHDTNRSGWLQLVLWVMPPIGTIVAVFWLKEPPRE